MLSGSLSTPASDKVPEGIAQTFRIEWRTFLILFVGEQSIGKAARILKN